MANIWEKFDKTINVEALKEEVKQAEEQGGSQRFQKVHTK